ncbi:MAG: hypothetical protein KBA99_03780 [Bacteroidia bacterium]|nr:hypothetical protein [Bacteroidia bacterium]
MFIINAIEKIPDYVDFFTNCWRTISVLGTSWHVFSRAKIKRSVLVSPSQISSRGPETANVEKV